MIAALLGWVALGAPMLFVEGANGVDASTKDAAIAQFAAELSARAGSPPIVLERAADCPPGDGCALELAAERSASPVLSLRLIGAVTRVRAVLRRVEGETLTVDLDPDRGLWPKAISAAVATLFLSLPAPAPSELGQGASLGPWLVLGGATAVAAGSIGLRVLSGAARDDLVSAGRTSAGTKEIEARATQLGTASDLLLAGALTGATAAVLWWALEP